MAEEKVNAPVRARVDWKLEKFDADGNLVETITGTDEAPPEVAQEVKAQLDSLPDQAAKGEANGTD
jgi:hypothetical protein